MSTFLYVVVKEVVEGKKGQKLDTELRIVYWPETSEYSECFVLYGKRPPSKRDGDFVPYRLICNTKEQVVRFAETVIDIHSSASVELHQFYGENDDSVDEFNIDWENTAENRTTELVAYDISGEFLNFRGELFAVLTTISEFDTLG
jgi:hypothetical protein